MKMIDVEEFIDTHCHKKTRSMLIGDAAYVNAFNDGISYIKQCLLNTEYIDIVKCKDCVHWGRGYDYETEHVKVCEYGNYMVGHNGYCIYGKEKSSDGDEK